MRRCASVRDPAMISPSAQRNSRFPIRYNNLGLRTNRIQQGRYGVGAGPGERTEPNRTGGSMRQQSAGWFRSVVVLAILIHTGVSIERSEAQLSSPDDFLKRMHEMAEATLRRRQTARGGKRQGGHSRRRPRLSSECRQNSSRCTEYRIGIPKHGYRRSHMDRRGQSIGLRRLRFAIVDTTVLEQRRCILKGSSGLPQRVAWLSHLRGYRNMTVSTACIALGCLRRDATDFIGVGTKGSRHNSWTTSAPATITVPAGTFRRSMQDGQCFGRTHDVVCKGRSSWWRSQVPKEYSQNIRKIGEFSMKSRTKRRACQSPHEADIEVGYKPPLVRPVR